ncbi:hypothetical protein B5807_01208 [Epicoccum nigrum]|uniref:HTH APSES-type domain-containing protein n=1 Tax=Epicoccum nigrum TaxID=105696 RepID=A0A1Y2ME92_EPING|nr:hypothetical protein B5807_01208 [Epicoccum nigrum]
MDIRFLLNPSSADVESHNTTSSASATSDQNLTIHTVKTRRQKLAKDAPIYVKGTSTVGHVNYPPHEAGKNTYLEVQHRQLGVHPLGQISDLGVRHIPYVSDKKHFREKTGREAFEMFQYTFTVPGDEKKYLVVWDYNVGLVRMTPFFKSCKYSKTVPAKALNQNPGLKEISYSITGGALVCQGYWVPWQAARELAATFCWDIRWALTPVFGNTFPEMCIPPRHPSFGGFIISPATVQFCTDETVRFRNDKDSYQLSPPKTASPAISPMRPMFDTPLWKRDIPSSPTTNTDGGDNAAYSTEVSPRSLYTPKRFDSVGRYESPTSPNSPNLTWAPTPQSLGSPDPETWRTDRERAKRTHSKVACGDGDRMPETADFEKTRQIQDYSTDEVVAAHNLMSLSVVARNAAALPKAKRTRCGFGVQVAIP